MFSGAGDGVKEADLNTIVEAWDRLVKEVLPDGLSPSSTQYIETRRAFYAGAALMHSKMTGLGDGDISEDAAMAMIDGWGEEIRLFAEQVSKGQA
jgi:hypothetical protein